MSANPKNHNTDVDVPPIAKAPSRKSASAALCDDFRRVFGRSPDGVWSAPGRVNLIGEHVDYAAGLCLPFALPHRTYVALARRTDGILRLRSAQETQEWVSTYDDAAPLTVDGWPAYVAGVLWSLGERFGAHSLVAGGFDILVNGYVPYGSGLSSSAALECAVAAAVAELGGTDLSDPLASDHDRARLVEACVLAENEFVGAPTGDLDQSASLRCTDGAVMLLDCKTGAVEHVPFVPENSGMALLVIDTRTSHSHASGEYGERRESVAEACSVLGLPNLRTAVDTGTTIDSLQGLTDSVLIRRVRHVFSEIERVQRAVALLRRGRVHEVAPLLTASHRSLRDDYEVSSPELDLAVDTALAAGALGARMTGGGFGGSSIALAEVDAVADVIEAVTDAFASNGLETPRFINASPSAGAGKDLDS